MITVKSSGRAGIIGNPTDGYGGAMIACSVQNKAEAIIKPAEHLIIKSPYGSKMLKWTNDFNNQGDYFDIPRAVLRYFKLFELRAEITIDSNIPEQGGLAGSTAVLAAVLTAVLEFSGKKYHNYYLAELNRILELNYLKCQCGYQDAYMTTFGGLNYLDFRGKEYYKDLSRELYATVEPLHDFCPDLPFVVAHTGVKHHSGSFHRPLRERWLEGDEQVVEGYKRITTIAQEGKKALLAQDWDYLGYLMNENHRLQDTLANSGEQNNKMIKIARENGALGAKLAGAGGGGTIIALTPDPVKTKEALLQAGAEKILEIDPTSTGLQITHTTTGNSSSISDPF